MPVTCWTFAVGGLALSGIPPFAGFFSKDEILNALKAAANVAPEQSWRSVYWAVYGLSVLTAFMTAFYTFRAFFKTFFGPEKLPSPDDPEAEEEAVTAADDHGHGHDAHGLGHDEAHLGHESPPIMTFPLIALAVCAFSVGFIFGWPWYPLFEHHLSKTFGFEALGHPEHAHGFDPWTAAVGTAVGLAGIFLAWVLYGKPSPVPARLAAALGPLYRASYSKFYVDELYELVVIRPLWFLAAVLAFLDENLVHGLVRLTAWVPRVFGREILAPFQNGLIQFYATVTALGVAGLLWILLLSR
jgi:NADH-quinone oxidoreductase subunit L